jgi:hypothetical protein
MAAGMRIAVLGALLALIASAPAAADETYTVYYCQGPSGQAASAEGLTPVNGKALLADGCPAGGLAAGPPALIFERGEGMGTYYRVPTNTRLVGYTLYRTVGLNNYFNWSLIEGTVEDLGTATRREICWTMASVGTCSSLGDGRADAGSRVADSGIDTAGLSLWIDCNSGGRGTCGPDGVGHPRVVMHRLDAILSDRLDPVFNGTPSGDLLDTSRPLTGVRSVSYSASDAGGGLYQAMLEVDGSPALTQVVDDNGGRCREPFLYPVPCKTEASGTLSFDTGTLPDDQHSLRLILTDVTKTNSVSFGPVQVTTSNQSARCDPTFTTKTTPVAAGFRGRKRPFLTRRGGRGVHVVGQIAGAGAGVPVLLLSREARTGARGGPVAQTTTGADGSFTLLVPPGPSRTLRAAVRQAATNPLVACSRALKLRVPARATLHVRPATVSPGHSIRILGRLRGGHVPRRGKLVALQAFERGRWQTFTTVRTNRKGSFRKRRGFSFTAAGRTFRLRVQVRPDASYPFALGYSRSVRVRVR